MLFTYCGCTILIFKVLHIHNLCVLKYSNVKLLFYKNFKVGLPSRYCRRNVYKEVPTFWIFISGELSMNGYLFFIVIIVVSYKLVFLQC